MSYFYEVVALDF